MSVQSGIYQGLLFLYPASFRREYGRAMTQAFTDRLTDRGTLRTWLVFFEDLCVSVPQQMLEVTVMTQKLLGTLAVLAAVVFAVAMGMGLASPIVLLGGAVVLVGVLFAATTRRSERPTEYVYRGGTPAPWTWWTVLAALLAVTYVVAAAGQWISDPKATNLGAVGIAIGFSGLIVMGLRLRGNSKLAGNWMVVFATAPALMFFWIIVPAVVGLAIIIGAVTEIARATPQAPQAA